MTLISYRAESDHEQPPFGDGFLEPTTSMGDLREPLREAANHLTVDLGPHPMAGIRRWLDHDSVAPGIIANSAELAEGGEACDQVLQHVATMWGAAPHVAAALAWKTYSYWSVLPAVLGYVSARRVPLWDPKEAHFIISRHNPLYSLHVGDARFAVLADDPMASRSDVVVAQDEEQLRQITRESLLDGHLDDVMRTLSTQARVGRRNLLGSLASGICYAALCTAGAGTESGEKIARDFLETFGVANLVDISSDENGKLVYQRHTCCLAFTLKGRNICSTCCLPEARSCQ